MCYTYTADHEPNFWHTRSASPGLDCCLEFPHYIVKRPQVLSHYSPKAILTMSSVLLQCVTTGVQIMLHCSKALHSLAEQRRNPHNLTRSNHIQTQGQVIGRHEIVSLNDRLRDCKTPTIHMWHASGRPMSWLSVVHACMHTT